MSTESATPFPLPSKKIFLNRGGRRNSFHCAACGTKKPWLLFSDSQLDSVAHTVITPLQLQIKCKLEWNFYAARLFMSRTVMDCRKRSLRTVPVSITLYVPSQFTLVPSVSARMVAICSMSLRGRSQRQLLILPNLLQVRRTHLL